MQHTGHRITFLQTFRVVCLFCLAAACLVIITPRDTSALSLTQTLKQLAKVKDSLKPKADHGNKTRSLSSPKKQSESSSTAVAASEPESAPQPVATSTSTSETPPVQQALPPEVEPIASTSNIPSRQQLLALVSEPLMIPAPFNVRTIGDYYPGINSFAVLHPSPEGWKFLGLSWIWWVAGSAAVWLGNRWLKWRS